MATIFDQVLYSLDEADEWRPRIYPENGAVMELARKLDPKRYCGFRVSEQIADRFKKFMLAVGIADVSDMAKVGRELV